MQIQKVIWHYAPLVRSFIYRNTVDMKTVIVPGDKKSKYKRERDLIGLSGDTHLCLFTAEADVEEDEVRMGAKMMRRGDLTGSGLLPLSLRCSSECGGRSDLTG